MHITYSNSTVTHNSIKLDELTCNQFTSTSNTASLLSTELQIQL